MLSLIKKENSELQLVNYDRAITDLNFSNFSQIYKKNQGRHFTFYVLRFLRKT